MSAPASFGGATAIGFYTRLILLINNISGPGIPSLPNMFAEAGWLLPILCLLGVYFMTTLSSCMFCEAMERMPGNRGFRGRSEYSTVVFHYFGRRWYLAAQVGLNGALQSLNIISVVQSAQVMDVAISALFGKTCALNLTPFPITDPSNHSAPTVAGSNSFFSCFNTADLTGGNAWGCHVVLTLGFALTAMMAIPCGRWNLDDNMIIQRGAFVLTVFCWVVWLVACLSSLSSSSTPLPAINTNPVTGSVAGVLGTILFNFGFVTTVPSWVNEKHPSTNINSALWSATSLCVLIFCLMGIPAALTFAPLLQGPVTGTCVQQQQDPSFNCANDLMQLLIQPQTAPWQSSRAATVLLQTSVYMFPIVAVVSSIPVFSIVIKYNLVENGASPRVAFAWGVLFPWICAFPLVYMPDLLGQFINFSSLLFVAFTDFIVPFALYFLLQRPAFATSQLSTTLVDGVATWPPPLLEAATPSLNPSQELHEGHEVSPHLALPCGSCTHPGASPPKSLLAVILGSILTALAIVATYLTIAQGTYTFDGQTCALVGN